MFSRDGYLKIKHAHFRISEINRKEEEVKNRSTFWLP